MAGWKRAEDVGNRIRSLREALGLEQSEIASLVGVYPQTVSDWETGRTKPSRSRIGFLASKFGVPVEAFAEGGPDPASLVNRPVNTSGVVYGHTSQPAVLRETTVADMDPRQVVRAAALAIADYRSKAGEDMPFEELTWWLGKVFEAGGRETRRALAVLERVSPDR